MTLLNGSSIDLDQLWRIAHEPSDLKLAPDSRSKMAASRAAVEKMVAEGKPVYGVNTGFGRLSNIRIAPEDQRPLQTNLVRSHACGIGPLLSVPETRAMMLLRANVLALGYSGARPELADLILAMMAAEITPCVPERGSVGASGDLAPLAHLALAMIGEGPVDFKGRTMPAGEAFSAEGLAPATLEAKEGLALLNGTQAMGAVGGLALRRALVGLRSATSAGAMTLEALKGTPTAFDPLIQSVRPHPGQSIVAAQLRSMLQQSEIRKSHVENDPRVQDAYSLRCMPQVHGAVLDVLEFSRSVLETEFASATDNPLVFSDAPSVLSGGNFHGAPLAYALDFAAIALCDLGAIIERRIDRLVNPDLNEGLPAFLAPHPGRSSGMMIVHVAAVSLLNECRVLAHPASIDNTPTSGGQEDHVSMGMTSALKLRRIVENLEVLIAIELIAAAQGLDYRLPLQPGRGVRAAHAEVRKWVPHLDDDRPLGAEIESLAKVVRQGAFDPG